MIRIKLRLAADCWLVPVKYYYSRNYFGEGQVRNNWNCLTLLSTYFWIQSNSVLYFNVVSRWMPRNVIPNSRDFDIIIVFGNRKSEQGLFGSSFNEKLKYLLPGQVNVVVDNDFDISLIVRVYRYKSQIVGHIVSNSYWRCGFGFKICIFISFCILLIKPRK